jgi:hypothetical protein
VPDDVRAYLEHTVSGRGIRETARDLGLDPSTILRRVRRIEDRRDDVLVDQAILSLERRLHGVNSACRSRMEKANMPHADEMEPVSEDAFEDEALRVLRRMSEQGAVLALAPNMATAVVVREGADGPALRTAVVARNVAEAMALKAWISTAGNGRILRYHITAAGRAHLRDNVARAENERAMAAGLADEPGQGGAQVPASATRSAPRYSLPESALITLARRRDRNGEPFLSPELVAAGERLREDYELARINLTKRVAWEKCITNDMPAPTDGPGARLAEALAALGPGLGDVALRCCCYLEGLEATERDMGWSARSGKIVLRIALQRLKLHYDTRSECWSPLIGENETRAGGRP